LNSDQAFDPEAFLALATRLLAQSKDEATLRTVISRAYYSAFLIVRARLGKRRTFHAEIWTEVEELHSALGGIGNRLRQLRNAADYGDPIPHLAIEAALCIRRANILLARVK
jgi:uncharacterized protein (UPF0332 family)